MTWRPSPARTWLLLACASALISTNWLIYIYAVSAEPCGRRSAGLLRHSAGQRGPRGRGLRRATQPRPVGGLTIAMAAVLLLSVGLDGPPLIAIGLALSFGLYGAVKKIVPTDPRVSVAVETAIAAPLPWPTWWSYSSAGAHTSPTTVPAMRC